MANIFFKNEKKIKEWLDKNNISKYELIPNEKYGFIVNVKTNVYLSSCGLEFIPIKFNIIDGDFNCEGNKLKTLSFAPIEVKGYFSCSSNNLKSLKGCPQKIEGSMYAIKNKINNLLYFPQHVNKSIFLGGNNIKTNIQNYQNKDFFNLHLKTKKEHEMRALNKKLHQNDVKSKVFKI